MTSVKKATLAPTPDQRPPVPGKPRAVLVILLARQLMLDTKATEMVQSTVRHARPQKSWLEPLALRAQLALPVTPNPRPQIPVPLAPTLPPVTCTATMCLSDRQQTRAVPLHRVPRLNSSIQRPPPVIPAQQTRSAIRSLVSKPFAR